VRSHPKQIIHILGKPEIYTPFFKQTNILTTNND